MNRFRIVAAICTLAAALPPLARSADFYVAPGGADT
jgi:hypothetical protein